MRVGMGVAAVALCSCTAALEREPVVRIEPAEIVVDVELEQPRTIDVAVFVDDERASDVELTLEGAEVGTVDHSGLHLHAFTGGTATLTVAVNDVVEQIPVDVQLHGTRVLGRVAPETRDRFAAALDVPFDAQLEPGDGAVLPPNLGTYEVNFAATEDATDHEISFAAPHLDLRIYARATTGPQRIALTPAEAYALASTTRGSSVDLAVRTLGASATTAAFATKARLAMSDHEVHGALLVNAVPTTYNNSQPHRYDFDSATMTPWSPDGGACVGCHVAVSPDGNRFAAVQIGSAATGMIWDAQTRRPLTTEDATRTWTSASYAVNGELLTANEGVMTVRDGTTAAALTTLAPGTPATMPITSPDGRWLAYAVLGAYPNLGLELRAHDWNPTTRELGAMRVLIPPDPDGLAIKEPSFSADGEWLVYTRAVNGAGHGPHGFAMIRADGTSGPIFAPDPYDSLARWLTPAIPTRAGGKSAERMAWLVLSSRRPIAGAPAVQLWLVGFYPDLRAFTRPILLPGQRRDLRTPHATRIF